MNQRLVGTPSYITQTLQDMATAERTGTMRQCRNCGRLDTPPEVDEFTTYIGGRGYTRVIQCRNIPACWKRREGK